MAAQLGLERPALEMSCSPPKGSPIPALGISQSVYRPTQPLPPLSTQYAQSSLHSLSEDGSPPPRCSPKSNRNASLCLPRGSVEILTGPATPRRLSERKHLLLLPPVKQTPPPAIVTVATKKTAATIMTNAGISAQRAETIETSPQGSSTQGMQGASGKAGGETEILSENIQQLIREADLAFKTVGAAIADLDGLSAGTPETGDTPGTTDMPPSSDHLNSDSKEVRLPSTPRPHTTIATGTPVKTPSRAISSSKVKRTKSKKSKKAKTNNASLADRVSRWTLSENVTDILKGNFLRKIEADEMLTPERLEVVRASRAYQMRQNVSRETLLTTSTDDGSTTPDDAFHLEDLAARIGSAGVDVETSPDALRAQSPSPSLDRPVRRDFSLPTRRTQPGVHRDSAGTNNADTYEIPPLSPPPKNPGRSAVKSTQLPPPLPTIPEVFAPKSRRLTVESPKNVFAPQEDDDFVFIQSTPYSLNMPSFRHGRIRLPKSDVLRGMNVLPDESMDWTAFQMAIGGGAGDIFSGPSDFARRGDEEGLGDLAGWFDEFGFEGAGALESAPLTSVGTPRRKRSRGGSGEFSSASSSATDPDAELPIPVSQEFPHGFWNDGSVDTSKFTKDDGRCKIKRWTLDGPPKKRMGNRDSTGSLPQSPMMQLVFVGQGDEGEFVPMGYNLGHDLGDFLKWETQQLMAYGPE